MASDGKTEAVSLRLDEEPREASEVNSRMKIYSLFFFELEKIVVQRGRQSVEGQAKGLVFSVDDVICLQHQYCCSAR